MGIFNNIVNKLKEQPTQSQSQDIKNSPISYTVVFEVAGIHHYMDNISKLATPMKKWKMTDEQIMQKYPGKRIYKNYYTNEPIQFVYEPSNPYDSNAIKVFINNIHVGYVPQSDCTSVKNILATNNVTITAHVSGGESKVIYNNGQKEEYSEPINIKVRIKTQR